MRRGALVITKNRWGMDSRFVGLVIEQVGWQEDDTWKVLWSVKGSYKIQEHLGSNLIDLSDASEQIVNFSHATH